MQLCIEIFDSQKNKIVTHLLVGILSSMSHQQINAHNLAMLDKISFNLKIVPLKVHLKFKPIRKYKQPYYFWFCLDAELSFKKKYN